MRRRQRDKDKKQVWVAINLVAINIEGVFVASTSRPHGFLRTAVINDFYSVPMYEYTVNMNRRVHFPRQAGSGRKRAHSSHFKVKTVHIFRMCTSIER